MAMRKTEGSASYPASAYLVVEDPQKPSTWHLRVRNVNGAVDRRLLGASFAALHGGYRGNRYQGPNKQDALRKLKELYASEGMPLPSEKAATLTVFKDASGAWRWLAKTTTAYLDRDGEILSTDALARDVARADADGRYGPLRWWHVGKPDASNAVAPWGPGLDLGWCDFNAVSGRTLIESGTFKSEAIARAIAARASDLELSPGFFHAASEPDPTGVFRHIHRFERSLVPTWAGRASNRYTGLYVQEKTMDPRKIEALKELGLPAETIDTLLADVAQTEKAADAAGVRYKEAGVMDRLRQWLNGDAPEMATKEAPPEQEAPPATDRLAALEAQIAALTTSVLTATAKAAAPPAPPAAAALTPATVDDTTVAVEEPMAEDAADTATGAEYVGDMTPEEFSALLEEVFARAMQRAMSGISDKMMALDEEMKALGYTRQKEDERASQIAAVKAVQDQQQAALDETRAKLAELAGDQPRIASVRPSQSPANVLSDIPAALKDAAPPAYAFDDILAHLMGKAS